MSRYNKHTREELIDIIESLHGAIGTTHNEDNVCRECNKITRRGSMYKGEDNKLYCSSCITNHVTQDTVIAYTGSQIPK